MTDPKPTPNPLIHVISRGELIQCLEAGRRRRLTLVQAPVGFGKTTLISQWQGRLKSDGLAVAWLTVRDDSWTPDLLLRAISTAVDAAGVSVKLDSSLLAGSRAESWRCDLDTLLEALASAATEIVIILDEYEHCDTPAVNSAVTQLLTRLPERVHVVITSRQRPLLPIARLYAEGQVTLIGADDLRLSSVETGELLQRHLTSDSIERVHRLTDGWVVLVQLVRLWLTAGGRPAAVIEALTDPRQEMARFLAEQVLTVLSDEERDFLVETSFLDDFTVELGNFVRGRDDSERFVDAMSHLYPLVSCDGGSHATIRVHPLLRAEARHLLSLRSRSSVAALQRRAAQWLGVNADVYLAMQHAIASGDPELAADLFERAGAIRIFDGQGPAQLGRTLDLLPEAIKASRPRVMLAQIAMLTFEGKLEKARHAYEDLVRRTADFTRADDPERVSKLRTDSLLCQMFFVIFCDETISSAALRGFEQIDLDSPLEDLQLRSFIAAFLAVSYLQSGELDKAAKAVHTAKVMIGDTPQSSHPAFSIIYEGMIDQIAGRLVASVAKLDVAIAMAEETLGARGRVALLTALSLKAEVLLDLGLLEEANATLHRAQSEFDSPTGWFDIYAPQLRTRCAMAFLSSGAAKALTAIDTFVAQVPLQSKRLCNLVLAHRIDACVRSGRIEAVDLDELRQKWDRLRSVPSAATWRELEALGLALVRASIALQPKYCARDVVDALELLAAQRGWSRTLVECHIVAAQADLAAGATERAHKAMREALRIASDLGIRSPFLLEGDAVAHLLAVVAESSPDENPVRAFAGELLRARRHIGTPDRLPFLTPREHLVLSELCHGHANKVIARNLGVSENTVKTHLKSIFRKADIQSREQAIEFARRHIGGA